MPKQRNAATRRKARAFLAALAAPAALFAFVLWTLHHPNPRVIAPVALDRNSFLPHHYAGPCLNCHRIKEIGPVAINAGNMASFPLSPIERQLVLAGQRVDVPDLTQKIRIPAITRVQNLPHAYVGVCSNCHVELDVHPSPEFMNQAMRNAWQPLLGQGTDPAHTARGGAIWDETRARNRIVYGFVALATLLIAAAALVARRVEAHRWRADAARQRRVVAVCLAIHGWSAMMFCVAATLHWYYSDRGNNFLHLALVLLSGLAAGGIVLRHRLFSEDGASNSRILLHVHRFTFAAFVGLLVLGHLFAGLG